MSRESRKLSPRGRELGGQLKKLVEDVGKIVVGQEQMVESLVLGLLTGGHVLLEGLPGLAKTLTVRTFAQRLASKFSRLQFTPDLLPADLVGTRIYNAKTGTFTIEKGPLFANIVLADEINRAPAKVQSALLEAMQEKQITIGGKDFNLEEPFLVLATQNPVETEGTYALPEAQIDRFLFKVLIKYPDREQELEILNRAHGLEIEDKGKALIKPRQALEARAEAAELFIDEKVKHYLLDLVMATRDPAAFGLPDLKPLIQFGGRPRASLSLAAASRAMAFLNGQAFVTPDEIRAIAHRVLRHRLILSYEAEAENVTSDEILDRILQKVKVP